MTCTNNHRKRVSLFMLRQTLFRFVPLLLIIFIVAACTNLAGDVEIVATVQTAPTQDAAGRIPVNPPTTMPDVQNGQRIFAENCTQCHGTTGDGNGQLVLSGEVPRMPSFLEATHVREQSTAFYYDMITNGNIVNLMPPWSQALSEQERWDVAMYVYTLHYAPEQVLQGAELYPDAPEQFSLESDTALVESVPAEGDAAWAAVAYERIRSVKNYGLLTGADSPGISNDPPPPEFMTFTGTVSHISADSTVPPGLEVVLRYGNFAEGLTTQNTVLDASNSYRFENIPYSASAFYLVTTTYNDVLFQSDVLLPHQLAESNELPLTITERTEDGTDISLTSVEIMIDRTTVDGMGEGMIFTQTNTYFNNSDQTLYRLPEGQDVAVSLLVQLPPGAIILNDSENPRYIIAQDFYSLIDTNPVFPGEHIVEAVYFLPHTEGDAIIDLALNNRFEGTLDIAVAVPSLHVYSEDNTIEFTGEEVVPGTNRTFNVKNFHAEYDLPAGRSLTFTVSGSLFGEPVSTETTDTVGTNWLIPIFVGVIVLFVFAFIGLVLLRRRHTSGSSNHQSEIDRLLAQINQLEQQHESGQINHDVFQRQRKELKDKLAALMRNSTAESDD